MTKQGSSSGKEWSIGKRSRHCQRGRAVVCLGWLLLLLSLGVLRARADQVEMQNGDRYVGTVLSLNTNTLVLQNEVLGTLRLPRGKVALIRLGSALPSAAPPVASPTTGQARTPSAARSTAAPDVSPAMRQLGTNTNLIRQIQKQFLGDAGPEANQKFEELLGGFLSGKVTMDDIRVQAQSAADQLRALKRDGGESPGFAADTYLAILDHFLKESAAVGSGTNAAAGAPASTPSAAHAEE
jgi:hypothetical protein